MDDYTLIHYKRTEIRGKYSVICTCGYKNKWRAYEDGRAIFDMTTDPNYAGFAIKDKDGKTLTRQLKTSAI